MKTISEIKAKIEELNKLIGSLGVFGDTKAREVISALEWVIEED